MNKFFFALLGIFFAISVKAMPYAYQNKMNSDTFMSLKSHSKLFEKTIADRGKIYEMILEKSKERIWELSKLGEYRFEQNLLENHGLYPELTLDRTITRTDGSLASCANIERLYEASLSEWEQFAERLDQLQGALGRQEESILLADFQDFLHDFEQSALRDIEREIAYQVFRVDLKEVFDFPNIKTDDFKLTSKPVDHDLIALQYDRFYTEQNDFGIDVPGHITVDIDAEFILTLKAKVSLFSACLDGWRVGGSFILKTKTSSSTRQDTLRCDVNSLSQGADYPNKDMLSNLTMKGFDCRGNISPSGTYHCVAVDSDLKLVSSKSPSDCRWVKAWHHSGYDQTHSFLVFYGSQSF